MTPTAPSQPHWLIKAPSEHCKTVQLREGVKAEEYYWTHSFYDSKKGTCELHLLILVFECMFVLACMCVSGHVCVCTCKHVCMCMHMCKILCACIVHEDVHMSVCVCTHMCVCVCVQTWRPEDNLGWRFSPSTFLAMKTFKSSAQPVPG